MNIFLISIITLWNTYWVARCIRHIRNRDILTLHLFDWYFNEGEVLRLDTSGIRVVILEVHKELEHFNFWQKLLVSLRLKSPPYIGYKAKILR